MFTDKGEHRTSITELSLIQQLASFGEPSVLFMASCDLPKQMRVSPPKTLPVDDPQYTAEKEEERKYKLREIPWVLGDMFRLLTGREPKPTQSAKVIIGFCSGGLYDDQGRSLVRVLDVEYHGVNFHNDVKEGVLDQVFNYFIPRYWPPHRPLHLVSLRGGDGKLVPEADMNGTIGQILKFARRGIYNPTLP
jgi:hypothetical protein